MTLINSVARMLVSTVYTGCSTMRRTPTAACQVEDHVGAVDEFEQQRAVHHGVEHVGKTGVGLQVGDIFSRHRR
ncbi:MAG TPA: hypothetical protein VNP04_05090 [Alphaproteobacteria bacterium]|nr:hypothetical protein [Alphaproteobacteria bacterium]